MQTIDVLAHPWLQIMLKQVDIADSTRTGHIRPGSENLTIVEREFYLVRIGQFGQF